MGDNTSPISVILVSSGSRGNKLLFRYPFQRSQEHPASQTSKWALGSGPGAQKLQTQGPLSLTASHVKIEVLYLLLFLIIQSVPIHYRVLFGKCRKVKRNRKKKINMPKPLLLTFYQCLQTLKQYISILCYPKNKSQSERLPSICLRSIRAV